MLTKRLCLVSNLRRRHFHYQIFESAALPTELIVTIQLRGINTSIKLEIDNNLLNDRY